MSSVERMREEWTVETTQGLRWPASRRAIAAFVPMTSARYMWLWITSGRKSLRWAASVAVAIASSCSWMIVTGMPRHSILRTPAPGESETTLTSYRSRSMRDTRL